jgi:hypothetical protein
LANLLSGVIGAVVGGILAFLAAYLTMRQQRSLALATSVEDWRQTRLSASYAASAKILSDMLIVKQGMWDARKSSDPRAQVLPTVHAAAERILVHNARIADKDLRSRINELNELINQWYELVYQADTTDESKRLYKLVIPYMEYMDKSIRAHIDDDPLPSHEAPPDLRAEDNAGAPRAD